MVFNCHSILKSFVTKSPLCCATLLPVKICEKFGDGKLILKNDQIFTGKSVAQQLKSWEPGSETNFRNGNNRHIVKCSIIDFSSCILILTHVLPGNPEYLLDTLVSEN